MGSLFARLAFSILTNPGSILRNGFVFLSLPGLMLSLVGHGGPDPAWTWRRQLAGAGIIVATVGLVLIGW